MAFLNGTLSREGQTQPSSTGIGPIRPSTTGIDGTSDLNDRAMQHPLCSSKATAYVGQTAKMYCCLARLDRELSVSRSSIAPHFLTYWPFAVRENASRNRVKNMLICQSYNLGISNAYP